MHVDWLFSFYGRIGRGRWWAAVFIQVVILFFAALFVTVFQLFGRNSGADPQSIGLLALFVWGPAIVVTLWISSATSVARLHDLGRSGLLIIPLYIVGVGGTALVEIAPTAGGSNDGVLAMGIIGILLAFAPLIYLGGVPGEGGENRFGEDPRSKSPVRRDHGADPVRKASSEDFSNQGRVENYSADLRQLQQLLNDGLITRDEYDAKKKQILGI